MAAVGTGQGSSGRRMRAAGAIALALTTMVGGVFLLLPFAARGVVRALALLTSGSIWLATELTSGASPWTVMVTIWRTALSTIVTPAVSAVLWALVLVGLGALYWLQRLLGGDQEI
jgi:hypothetical protein